MSVDPTPTSDHLARDSKEAVRGGTRTRFNLWVLLIGLALVIAGFAWIWASRADDMASTREDIGMTRQDAAEFDTTLQPAKGDSPVEGESVNPANAGTTPSQENPRAE
jgi:hypothetical protein